MIDKNYFKENLDDELINDFNNSILILSDILKKVYSKKEEHSEREIILTYLLLRHFMTGFLSDIEMSYKTHDERLKFLFCDRLAHKIAHDIMEDKLEVVHK